MSNADRRHAVLVARRFLERTPDTSQPAVAAALLHDCGKTPAGLGTFGRTVATIVGPRRRHFRAYHAHEAIGAELARAAGSDPLTVQLIARDPKAPAAVLSALAEADEI
jgi:HD superfamily phosphohydrolase